MKSSFTIGLLLMASLSSALGAVKVTGVTARQRYPWNEAEYLGGVQLWENGPYWAECNVGATKPEEVGYYFWWGDTVGYKRVGDRWDAVDGSHAGLQYNDENIWTEGSNENLQKEGTH